MHVRACVRFVQYSLLIAQQLEEQRQLLQQDEQEEQQDKEDQKEQATKQQQEGQKSVSFMRPGLDKSATAKKSAAEVSLLIPFPVRCERKQRIDLPDAKQFLKQGNNETQIPIIYKIELPT